MVHSLSATFTYLTFFSFPKRVTHPELTATLAGRLALPSPINFSLLTFFLTFNIKDCSPGHDCTLVIQAEVSVCDLKEDFSFLISCLFFFLPRIHLGCSSTKDLESLSLFLPNR